jgi:hypothetical protein
LFFLIPTIKADLPGELKKMKESLEKLKTNLGTLYTKLGDLKGKLEKGGLTNYQI